MSLSPVRSLGLALAALALAGAGTLVSCGQPSSPAGTAGDLTAVREPVTGAESSILLPTGRIDLTVGDPVASVPADQTQKLTAIEAPDGGSLVPVGWSYDRSAAPWGQDLAAPSLEPEVSLRIDSRSYALGSPYTVTADGAVATSPDDGYFVAVEGSPSPDEITLEVEYDGVAQVVDAASGERDPGLAADLYDLPLQRPGGVRCPNSGWQEKSPALDVRLDCTISSVGRSPYYPEAGWAPEGREWVVVEVPEVRLLRAVATDPSGSTSYRVLSITDVTTLGPARPVSPLVQQPQPREYVVGGTLVFAVARDATDRLRLSLDVELEAADVSGASSAPDSVRLSVSHPVDLPD
ncbi:MAG: hypothetical protein WKF79_11315 [Nocardioides sp.]